MKRIAFLLALALIVPAFMTAADADLTWHSRLDEALKLAQKDNKPLMLFFTGSDWCIWCKRLVGQILSQPGFMSYAEKELVLVKFDFPRNIPMDTDQKEYNAKIAKEYQIQGFPTIIMLNAKGEKLGQTGYQDLSPEAYVEHLKAFIK